MPSSTDDDDDVDNDDAQKLLCLLKREHCGSGEEESGDHLSESNLKFDTLHLNNNGSDPANKCYLTTTFQLRIF